MGFTYSFRRSTLAAAVLSVVVMAVAACAGAAGPTATPVPTPIVIPSPTPTPIKMVFMAGFKPQANLPFVAAYIAKEKGFFHQQSLDVDIKHAFQGEHLRLLLNGDVQVTTANAESVLKRIADPGAPIVAFVLFGQQGEQAYITLKDSGIRTPKDWEGKTFGYKTTIPPDYLAILKANNVDRSKVKEVRVGFDPRPLLEKRVDVLAVFLSNEPDTIRRLGFDVNVFTADAYGVPSMGLTYIATQDYAQKNPEALTRFLKATMRALYWAMEHPEEAVDIVLKYAPDEDREHQRYMFQTELAGAQSDLTRRFGLGWMTREQWAALHDQFVQFEAIKRPIDVNQAYTDEFLRRTYKDGKLLWP